MNGFNRREKGFEAKYLHDEELAFRIKIKRNHLLGLWIAPFLGYFEERADRYAEEIITIEIQKSHEDDLVHKILRDLEAAHVEMSEHQIRKELENCLEKARQIIMNKEGL